MIRKTVNSSIETLDVGGREKVIIAIKTKMLIIKNVFNHRIKY
jgi:hypothetical protein